MSSAICSYPTCSQLITNKGELKSGLCKDHLDQKAHELQQKQLKEKYKGNPPEYACLVIPHTADEDLKSIGKYLYDQYHFDIGYCPENEATYENLYYNSDERSFMGWVLEYDNDNVTVQIITPSYRSGGGCWQDYWEKLLKASEIVDCDKFY